MRITVGSRVFAPSWMMTTAALLFGSLFVTLGFWQWTRGVERQSTWDAFAARAEKVVDATEADLAVLPRFARVRLHGSYLPAQQFLLDNRTYDGRAGYEVLTPFALARGGTILVNRGWLQSSGFRDRLPNIGFDATSAGTPLEGRLEELPQAGLESGRAAPALSGSWPRVTSFPTNAELSAALGRPLTRRLVLLDASAANGYTRDWAAPGLEPIRHFSYAVQWWAFAVLLTGLYIGLNLRKETD